MNRPVQFALGALLVLLAAGLTAAEKRIAQDTSIEGTWEGELQTERWPVFLSLDLQRSAEELGGSVAVLGSVVPLSQVTSTGEDLSVIIGSGDTALTMKGKLRDGQFAGMATQGSETMPFTLERVQDYPPPANRIEAWNQDIDALTQRFIRWDRSFTPAERALFHEKLEGVRSRLPELNDDQIRVQLAGAMALSGNAHTRLYLLRNRTELRRLPLRLWWFRDSLRVVRATPEYRNLLGCRIDRIGSVNPRHARDIVSAAFAGNPSWTDYKSVYYLTSPEILRGFGITPDADQVGLEISDCGAPVKAVVKPLPLEKKTKAAEAWRELSPHHLDGDRDWVHSLDPEKEKLPLYLQHPDLHYWFKLQPESGLLYVQYNRSSDSANESTSQFGERLIEALTTLDVKGFVLDLRFNTGGNLHLGEKLMLTLQERTASMPRWVITGRATFSAGITAAASWRIAGRTTFVGEPVGDDLDMWAEGGNIILPNSALHAHFANGAHSYSMKPCPQDAPCLDMSSPELGPDIAVMSTWEEYSAGRDPAMEEVELDFRTHRGE